MAERLTREALNALQVTAPDLPSEHHHLYRCAECGLLVDRRDLGDVLHHEKCGHEPIGPLLGLGFIEPMLPTLVREAPEGDDWLHEIKHDGYRTQLVLEPNRCRAFTRNGHDWTDRYQRVVGCAAGLPCRSAILDGDECSEQARGI